MDQPRPADTATWLVPLLAKALDVPESPLEGSPLPYDGAIRSHEDLAIFVSAILNDPKGELAPVLIEFFTRRVEPAICWEG